MKPAASRLLQVLAIAVFATMALLAPTAGAQEARGTILGKVRDANDSVMPGASVKITDVARGTTATVTTNDAGLYQAPYLLPGTYRIVVEVTGFKKFVREGVVLRIGDTLDITIQLEVGQTTETLTVTAQTPTLDTTSASMGQTVDSRRVAELPLVHGDPYTLIGLSAGVAFGRDPKLDRPFEPTHIVGYTMDGTRANRSDLTIDGVTSTATANANEVTASYVPPTDIIQEFKVQTATFDSQFGNTEGGVTSIAIKSGTNSLHGTAYFWGEPGSLAANDFFANRANQPRPESFSNRYGGSVGGPVYIPKVYNGKNKTFFLWGYERISDARPRNNGTPTIPTQAMKNGDFSALLPLGAQYQIYNPFSRRAEGSRFRVDPFMCDSAGNPLAPLANKTQPAGTPCNKIPTSLFNPVSVALLKFFPDPTTPGSAAANGTNNFQQPGLQERASYFTNTIRIDHNLSDKHRIFVRGSHYDRDSTYNNYFNNLATGTLFQFLSRQGAIDDVYTFNSTTVLNVRYGYNRFIRVDGYNPANKGFDLTSVGFPASYNNAIPEDNRRFPRIDLTGYQGTGFNNEPRPIDTHSIVATLNKTLGPHSLKGGTEFRSYRENSTILINDVTGRFVFDNTYTKGPLDNSTGAPNSLGQSVAALLLGIPSPSSYVRRPASYAEQSTTWGFFVQDDWKFNPRLTLNLGLRYEFETPLTERYNRSVRGFDYGFVQPIEAQAQANYAKNPTPEVSQLLVRGGLTFAGVNGQDRGLYETPKNSFMPRLGVAFKLNEKTVVRAGYGIFFGFLGQRRGDINQAGFSRDTNFVPTADGVNFIGTLSNPFPNGIQEPVGAGDGPRTFLGQAVTFFNPNPLTPYNQRWELGFQRELMGGWVAEASYVGNRGTHIEITRNINVTPQKYLSQANGISRDEARFGYLTANLQNPFSTLIPGVGASTSIAREGLLRPFPQFSTVTTTTNEGYSWYHALQARIEKRFSKGYTFQASYTFSKFMQATELLNQDDVDPTEVISDSDYPHRFAMSAIYELPFGKGQKFLADANGIVSRFIGGWQLQGVYTFQSGAPIGFGNIAYVGDLKDIRLSGDQQTPEHWFNTPGFVALRSTVNGVSTVIRNTNGQPVWVDFNDPCKNTYNAATCPGTPLANPVGFNRDSGLGLDRNLRTFPLRFGFIRFPRQNNVDFSVVKNTSIKEGMRLQFRAEFINFFNRAWFANPNGTNGLDTNVTSATFGQINGSTGANYARRVQLGLKLLF
jgi:Carboxypeptidase regulatory-like domain